MKLDLKRNFAWVATIIFILFVFISPFRTTVKDINVMTVTTTTTSVSTYIVGIPMEHIVLGGMALLVCLGGVQAVLNHYVWPGEDRFQGSTHHELDAIVANAWRGAVHFDRYPRLSWAERIRFLRQNFLCSIPLKNHGFNKDDKARLTVEKVGGGESA